MATREENLKKINDELEQLSDAELDDVAGGTHAEYSGMNKRINSIIGEMIVNSQNPVHKDTKYGIG